MKYSPIPLKIMWPPLQKQQQSTPSKQKGQREQIHYKFVLPYHQSPTKVEQSQNNQLTLSSRSTAQIRHLHSSNKISQTCQLKNDLSLHVTHTVIEKTKSSGGR